MELIDTHCHIHFENYALDPAVAIENARENNVTCLICVGCSLHDSELAVEFAQKHENVWASVGAHPHDGKEYLSDPQASKKLEQLLISSKVVACGEIGLDYYHKHTEKTDQIKILRQQIETALPFNKPFIFHVREAFDDFWQVVGSYPIKNAVVHSFSSGKHELNQILERGFYVGLNGIMTFTKDESQLEAAKAVPLDKLLLETDAPFLAPKPDRGKVCEPKHIKNVAEFLAELRRESVEQIAKSSTANAKKLFNIS